MIQPRNRIHPALVILLLFFVNTFSFSYPKEYKGHLSKFKNQSQHPNSNSHLYSYRHTVKSPSRIFESIKDTDKSTIVASNSNNNNKDDRLQNIEITSMNTSIPWKNYGVLAALLLAFTSNQWTRQLINYLCNFSPSASQDSFHYVNVALHFNQEFYAALASFAFTAIFAIVSLFAGTVADNYDRKIILSMACLLWSLVTVGQSYVTEAWQLIPLRVILGASQAFFNPSAYTILSDIFPSQMLASVNSVLSSGVYVGGGLASLSILLDSDFGWRTTMVIVGFVGITLAGLSYFVLPEPRKGKKIESILSPVDILSKSQSFEWSNIISGLKSAGESLKDVLSISDVQVLLISSLLRFAAGFTIAIWKAPFVYEKFPGNEELFSSGNAFIITVGGLISSLLGGVLADKISSQKKSTRPRSRIWIPAIGSLLAVPAWTLFITATDPKIAAASLLLEYLVAECWIGPTIAVLYSAVPKNRRGTTQGIFSILVALGNLAPYLVGVLTGGSLASFSIGQTIMWVVDITYFLSALGFIVTAVKEDKVLMKKFVDSSTIDAKETN